MIALLKKQIHWCILHCTPYIQKYNVWIWILEATCPIFGHTAMTTYLVTNKIILSKTKGKSNQASNKEIFKGSAVGPTALPHWPYVTIDPMIVESLLQAPEGESV